MSTTELTPEERAAAERAVAELRASTGIVPPSNFSAGVHVAPTVKPAAKEYGGGGWSAPIEFDFETPSGALCRLRKIGQEEALSMGFLNHLDLFSSELMKDADGRKKPTQEIVAEIAEKLARKKDSDDFFGVVSRVVMEAVVKPTIVEERGTDESPLPPGVYSIHSIDLKDKMAIFRAVLGEGLDKIAPFREGQESGVGSMESGESVQHNSVENTGNP